MAFFGTCYSRHPIIMRTISDLLLFFLNNEFYLAGGGILPQIPTSFIFVIFRRSPFPVLIAGVCCWPGSFLSSSSFIEQWIVMVLRWWCRGGGGRGWCSADHIGKEGML